MSSIFGSGSKLLCSCQVLCGSVVHEVKLLCRIGVVVAVGWDSSLFVQARNSVQMNKQGGCRLRCRLPGILEQLEL